MIVIGYCVDNVRVVVVDFICFGWKWCMLIVLMYIRVVVVEVWINEVIGCFWVIFILILIGWFVVLIVVNV